MTDDLDTADTWPAPPPMGADVRPQSDDPSPHSPTWPKFRAVRFELETDILDGEEIER